MHYRPYGTSSINVSALGYGAGHIGGDMDEDRAGELLNRIVDMGINLIDTARGYGLSEERIGRHLSWRRKDIVISTKVGYGVEGCEDWTYECIIRGVERALGMMRTDYIDIVHLHSCPAETLRRGDVTAALTKCVADGRVRCAAYSGDNEDLAAAMDSGVFSGFEASLNICDQRIIADALPAIRSAGKGLIAKRPVANAPWRFEERPHGNYAEEYWVRWKAMGIDPGDISWNELALRFAAFTPGITSCIVGSANLAHIEANRAALDKGELPAELYRAVRGAFTAKDEGWTGQV